MRTKLILGGPGAGKTTRLLTIMEEELANGIAPDRIAFVSFTRKATTEAKERAMEKFGFGDKQLPYFRTIHSLCHKRVGARSSNIMDVDDYRKIADRLGVDISKNMLALDGGASMKEGDRMVYMDNLARNTDGDLEQVWMDNGEPCHFGRLQQWAATVDLYKLQHNKWDFTDLLHEYIDSGASVPVDVAIVDEAQDLTPVEWRVVEQAFSGVQRLYVAGDDDQAIYTWSGADVKKFLSIPHDDKEVLPVSYRLPTRVFDYATAYADGNITDRYEKSWGPHPDNGDGFVREVGSVGDVSLMDGTWFLLARNSCFLQEYVTYLRDNGFVFMNRSRLSINEYNRDIIYMYERWRKGLPLSATDTFAVLKRMQLRCRVTDGEHHLSEFTSTNEPWYKALRGIDPTMRQYYRRVLKRYGTLHVQPRIFVNTIHAVKGGEADYVVLSTDRTRRCEEGNQEDESRVFYVGATRAKKGLYVMLPKNRYYFNLTAVQTDNKFIEARTND